jgi:hypothetical protein
MFFVTQTINIPQHREEFHSNEIFKREHKIFQNEWNVNATRNRMRDNYCCTYGKADKVKANKVLDFFVECGAMLRTLKRLPLDSFKVTMEECIKGIEQPYGKYVAQMWEFLRRYPRDWEHRDTQMFPFEIDRDIGKVRQLAKKLGDWE